MEDYIFEPLQLYNDQFKDRFHEEATSYFDELVEKSNVDVSENRKTTKKYYKAKDDYEKGNKKLSGLKTLKVFMIIFDIISIIVAVIGGLNYFLKGIQTLTYLLLFIIGAVLFITLLVLLLTVIKKKIKEWNEKTLNAKKDMDNFMQICLSQMAPLNKLFDWNMPANIMSKVTPLLHLDKYFDRDKFNFMKEKYGFNENTNPHSSTENVLSGSINGNPFLMVKTYNQEMRPFTYSGTLTIHWTTTTTVNGRTQVNHHSQTLVAHVTKPAPIYYHNTELIFANDAAPKLKFTREASNVNLMNDKKLKSYLTKEGKKLDDKFRKAIKNGGSYTKLANSDFEVLFGADDRNDEVEFRVLFTPMAQREIVKLVKSKNTYGDDFSMRKHKCLNFIRSAHSQKIDYVADPSRFAGFDIDKMKENFVNYNDTFLKGLYFDLAPLLAIPIYQQTQNIETIYEDKFTKPITSFEHEAISNRYNRKVFAPEGSVTDSILKASIVKNDKNTDLVNIKAHSFYRVAHTDMVPTPGGDGCVHMVPVVWYEYLPLERDTLMCMTTLDTTRSEFNEVKETSSYKETVSKYTDSNSLRYERNILSFISSGNVNKEMITKLNDYFKKRGE